MCKQGCFNLRMMLHEFQGLVSFEELQRDDRIIFATYREECAKSLLLQYDNE